MRALIKSIGKHISAIILVRLGVHIIFSSLGIDLGFAQSSVTPALTESLQSKIFRYNSILNALYLLLWPALALAGFALDNSLIYGSLFGLDEPLFLIWNIIKNIANFTLGFMVLFEILKSFFTTNGEGKKAFEIIKKSLIAGVLIQASWFLMGAIIDVSTIATYSIGSMPISILSGGNCQDLGNTKLLPIGAHVDFTASNQNFSIDNSFQYYYFVKTGEVKTYYAPCEIYNSKWIVGQKYRSGSNNIPYAENYCILPNNMFAFFSSQVASNPTAAGLDANVYQQPSGQNAHITYANNLRNIMNLSTGSINDPIIRSGRLASGLIFDTTQAPVSGTAIGEPGIYTMYTQGLNPNPFDQAPMLKEIIKQADGYVGVLITLYKSVLNFVSFNTGSSSTDTFVMFLEIGIKVVFGIAMLLPLIVMAVALIIRVGYIWMFIALSPILALKIAFGDEGSTKNIWASIPIIKDGIGDVLRMIFAPVIIVFAVSFCLVFMTGLVSSINNTSTNNTACISNQKQVYQAFGAAVSYTGNTTSYQISNMVEVKQTAFGLDISGPQRDIFGWLLINLFGAAIVWLLLFTVIETVFKGTPVGNWKLKEIAQNMIGSIPIIPVPDGAGGVSGIGLGTAAKLIEAKSNDIAMKLSPNRVADDFLNKRKKPQEGSGSTGDTNNSSTTDNIINNIAADNTKKDATIGAIASAGLGSSTALNNIAELNEAEKSVDITQLSKKILIDDTFYKGFYDKIKGDIAKIKVNADWIDKNKETLLSKDEFAAILKRNDELANYLKPKENGQIIKLSDNTYVMTFNTATGNYDFAYSADSPTYTMHGQLTAPDYNQATTTGSGNNNSQQ